MQVELKPHPDTPCDAVQALTCQVLPGEGTLTFRYELLGDLGRILVPGAGEVRRTDELWRHTCLEAFVQPAGEAGYLEFNFAPSGSWAAYRFTGYRAGMSALDIETPQIDVARSEGRLELSATVAVDGLAARLGLSAVIETSDGRLSYWAATHPPGRPDFHHPDCFSLQLPPSQTI